MQGLRTGRASAILVILSSSAICSQATFQCFTTPPGSANRKGTTLTVGDRGWLSHDITSAIVEIVLREVLGYTVTTAVSPVDTSTWGPDLTNGVFDMDMESWQAISTSEPYKEYVSGGQQTVMDLGGIGYAGRSGMWTLPRLANAERFADYFKFYQNFTAASKAGVQTFADSQLASLIGDAFPVCDAAERSWCGTGVLEGYWATPMCRQDPNSCLEFWMAVPGYDPTYFEQLAKNNDVPAVFGYYGWGLPGYVRSAQTSGPVPVFYWYAPDPFLLEVNAVRISFPDHFMGCDRGNTYNPNTGTVGCDYAELLLKKVVARRILNNAPEAYFFLSRILILEDQINALMRTMEVAGGNVATPLEAGCNFLKANMADVALWVPNCVMNPPSIIVDGSEVFNPDTMSCETVTIFYTAPPTNCFPNSPRPGTADRSDRTIKLVRRNWLTHDLTAMVTEVILRDYLGFTVELVLNNRTSTSRWGPEMEANLYDIDMESWQVDPESALYAQYIKSDPPIVVHLGATGFPGRSGAYVPGVTAAKHKMSDYFRFFENGTEAVSAGFASFGQSTVRQELGGSFPVCNPLQYSWCGTGALEGYYGPTKCVADPDSCVEFIHASPGWETGYLEQLADNLNLDIVFGYYGGNFAQTILNKKSLGQDVIFYYWEPDAFISQVQGQRVSFPDYSFGCDLGNTRNPLTGTVKCDFSETALAKIATVRVLQANPEAHYALERLQLFLDQINDDFLAEHVTAGGTKTSQEVVCNFITNNADTIRSWAPDCLVNPISNADIRVGDTLWSPSDMQCRPKLCLMNQVLQYVEQAGEAFCTNCSAGEVPNADQTQCRLCPKGEQPSLNGSVCEQCDAGSVKAAGLEHCLPCQTGRYQNSMGQDACEACPQGSYQPGEGSTGCISCDTVLFQATTRVLAATASSECMCPQGWYRPLGASSCERCPDGMTCQMGADMLNIPNGSSGAAAGPYPQVEEGFMTRPGEPLTVYECLESKHCPGGPPGACASLRDNSAVACGECVGDAYETDSACKACQGGDVIPIMLAAVAAIICVVVLTIVINKNLLMQTSSTMMCIVLLGMMFTGIQTMGVFRQLEVEWFEPMDTLFEVVTLLSFDLKILKVACVIGSNGVTGYMLRQLVAPVSVPFVLFILMIRKRYDRRTKVTVQLLNTVGSVFNVFFISIMLSALMPFVCYEHPGDSGRSVVSNPAILCDLKDDHLSLTLIGMGACLLVPLPFVVIVGYGVWAYPRRVSSGMSEDFLAMFRFLFFRFHPHAYWFGAIIVVRSLLTCLLPVAVNDTGVQVVLMAGLLCFFTIIQQQVRPWRSDLANLADGVLNILMVMLLLCAALMSDLSTSTNAIQAVGSITFIITIALALLAFGTAMHKKFFPGKKYFAFVCHHKADAGAQARYLKILLVAKTKKKVFIDSDDLTELDKLFDIVKTSVANLIVYLTRDTLRRPWCAGEVVTAWSSRGRVKMTSVRTGSFVRPTEDELKDLGNYLDINSCNIVEQGISFENIAIAIRHLLGSDVPSIVVNWETISTKKFAEIVAKFAGETYRGGTHSPLVAHDGALYISVEHGNDEACAASGILMAKLEERVLGFMDGGIVNLLNFEETIQKESETIRAGRAVVFLLSGGTLQSERQVSHIVSCMSQENMASPMKPAIIPVNLRDFKFPTDAFYMKILPAMWNSHEDAQTKCKAFFKLISVSFTTNAADSILDTQAAGIERRIPRRYDRESSGRAVQIFGKREPSASTNAITSTLSERYKAQSDEQENIPLTNDLEPVKESKREYSMGESPKVAVPEDCFKSIAPVTTTTGVQTEEMILGQDPLAQTYPGWIAYDKMGFMMSM